MDPLEELIRAQPGLSFMLAALGLVVGSFLNVVIHRLPKMMEAQWARDCAEYRDEPAPDLEPLSLAYPGSQCPCCRTKIKAWQNIPVVSYLVFTWSLCELRSRYFTTLPTRGDGYSPSLGNLWSVVWGQ